jgi:hypothetical protein
MASANATLASALMRDFAGRTGLSTALPPRRYLWTDAFAVCNFLALARIEGGEWSTLALALVDQVHRVLGRHRGDDWRSGWISGLDEAAGARHPTRGGLRIGKPLPERRIDEAPDDALEWERDGQYFHYLTRWMHALDQFARLTGHADAGRWACELAQAAQRAFTWPAAGGAPRMVWKMSIDLQRPLVTSMGQHDPLDGLVTCLQLQAHRMPGSDAPDLEPQIRALTPMAMGIDPGTDDPLGIGGLLVDAWKLLQLPRAGRHAPPATRLLDAAASGLDAWLRQRPLDQPAARRLAFRELGCAIGLHAMERIRTRGHPEAGAASSMQRLTARLPLAAGIEGFWLQPSQQQAPGWLAHLDIDAVMLASSLLATQQPDGYLDLA